MISLEHKNYAVSGGNPDEKEKYQHSGAIAGAVAAAECLLAGGDTH
jgi:hypothetical protein